MNGYLKEKLIGLKGERIADIQIESLHLDGSGPCALVITFESGREFQTEIDYCKFLEPTDSHEWRSDKRATVLWQVLEDSRE